MDMFRSDSFIRKTDPKILMFSNKISQHVIHNLGFCCSEKVIFKATIVQMILD